MNAPATLAVQGPRPQGSCFPLTWVSTEEHTLFLACVLLDRPETFHQQCRKPPLWLGPPWLAPWITGREQTAATGGVQGRAEGHFKHLTILITSPPLSRKKQPYLVFAGADGNSALRKSNSCPHWDDKGWFWVGRLPRRQSVFPPRIPPFEALSQGTV